MKTSTVPLKLRLPKSLHSEIVSAAQLNCSSLNAEIINRLGSSLREDAALRIAQTNSVGALAAKVEALRSELATVYESIRVQRLQAA